MKLRHAAAFALVGWYLMQPPAHRGTDGKSVFEDARPLTMWRQIGAYDTAKECEAQIDHMVTLPTDVGAEFVRCVASDDPRLKRN